MIVTCEKCSTRFELDDAKVPKQGIRVRCSQCKHAFLIEPPGADRVQRAAEEAISGSPEPSQDLPDTATADPDQDSGSEPEWTFNHDFGESPSAASPVDPGAVARDTVDDMLGDSSPESDSTPDLRTDADESFGLAGDDSSSDVVDDIDDQVNLADDDSVPDLVDHGSLPSDFSETGDESSMLDVESESESKSEPESGDAWDIRWGDPDGEEKVHSTPSATSEGDASLASAPVDVASGVSAASIRLGQCAQGVGWMITLVLVVATLYGGLRPRPAVSVSGTPLPVLAGMETESVSGRWIENAAAGPIFLVSGTLRATGPGPVSPRLAVGLFDAQGEALEDAAMPIAPLLARRSLRESDPQSLDRYQRDAAQRLGLTVLEAGERRAFQALFLEVPAGAEQFRLVALPTVGDPRP
ncbi:MAG: zinc-ribbon domain-containing protein [Myxococcota bacterium]